MPWRGLARPDAVLLRRVVCAACLALAGLAVAVPPAKAARDRAGERTLTVSAVGRVTAEPDVAVVTAGVVTEAETARAALAGNSQRMRRVVDALKQAGIPAREIATTALSVQPRYDRPRRGEPSRLVGFVVRNSVRFRVRPIARLGPLLDEVVSLGANQVGGIQFEVSEADEIADRARLRAIGNAKRKARLYARAAGVSLGPVIRIEEATPQPIARSGIARMAVAERAAPPIERGQVELAVRVTVVWGLE